MTDRIHSLTITLEHDMRDDDVASLMMVIQALRGVREVQPEISDPSTYYAYAKARHDITVKLLDVLRE